MRLRNAVAQEHRHLRVLFLTPLASVCNKLVSSIAIYSKTVQCAGENHEQGPSSWPEAQILLEKRM